MSEGKSREILLSAVAIEALKEALTNIYWYKSGLKSFLQNCIGDHTIVFLADWEGYKRQIVSDIVDTLCRDQAKHIGDLRRLFHEVCRFEQFDHLAKLEDGHSKVQKARDSVEILKKIVAEHDEEIEKSQASETRRSATRERIEASSAVRAKLKELNSQYCALISSADVHSRGYALERLMYELFNLFDLDPKASFKVSGEQLDGAFSIEGTDYLFEAKWENKQTSGIDLDGFSGKIGRKLENTLGLFLSISGFSRDAVALHSSKQPNMILMTGTDLMAVLEERIDFVELMVRKRRHAAQTGNILLEIHEIL